MRIAEISDPISFHTEHWAKQLKERGVEPYIVYVKDWIGKLVSRKMDYDCDQFLMSRPDKTDLIISLMKRGKLVPLIKGVMNGTSLFSQLEFYRPILAKYFRENEIDVIHGHQLTGGALLAHASKFKPAVVSAWGSDLERGPTKYPYLQPLIKRVIERSDIIHTESEVSAKIIRQIYPIDDERLFISSWGVDTDLFVRNIDTDSFRQKYGIQDQPIVIHFRNLEPFYRPDLIIRAFALVLKEHPKATLLIGNDGPLREELIHLCADLNIRNNVVFTGYLYGEDVAKAFAISDVYVQCPLDDGVSIAGMQAMSARVPIVANNVGEVSAFLKDGINGFFVNETDRPEDYAEKISLLLHDDNLRKNMGAKSREIALKEHSRKTFLDKYISLLESLKEKYQA